MGVWVGVGGMSGVYLGKSRVLPSEQEPVFS